MERRIADERKRLERQVADLRADETEADARLAAAKAQTARAWGWYRDKGSMKAQLEEEKADAEARTQYEKDFEHLRSRRDWRTAKNLSVDDEAVRRVALAKEEESAAREYARQTAEAAQRGADALERLLAQAEGGEE